MKILVAGVGYVGTALLQLVADLHPSWGTRRRRHEGDHENIVIADAATGVGLTELPREIEQIAIAISPRARTDDASLRAYPEVINQPERLDYGDAFEDERRIDQHPPLRTNNFYGVRAPAFDADDNERGGVRLPRVAVPVASYTGWNLRNPAIGAPTELLHLSGSRVPFARTPSARAAGDPRPAVSERYDGFDDYRARYLETAQELVDQGYLLSEHLPGLETVADSHRELFER